MSPHQILVNASVPTDWLPSFIGHRVWSRGRWAVLLDVWIEDGVDRDVWISRRRAVRDAKGTRVEACAQVAYVRGVPEDECVRCHLEEGISVWDWEPPVHVPVGELPVRPKGWRPPATPPRPIDITPTTHDPQGDEFALFTLEEIAP